MEQSVSEREQAEFRAAGAALVLAAAGSALALSHHPTSAGEAAMGMVVHGVLIALAALAAAGFLLWARARGLGRPLVAGGLVAYGLGLAGNIGAALINGFALTALATGGEPIGHDVVRLAWEMNQALAGLGVVATGTALALWGADLLRSGPIRQRLLGAAGIVAGLVPAALLLSGVLRMNLAVAGILYGAHLAWTAWLGVTLLARPRRRKAELREA